MEWRLYIHDSNICMIFCIVDVNLIKRSKEEMSKLCNIVFEIYVFRSLLSAKLIHYFWIMKFDRGKPLSFEIFTLLK